MIWSNKVIHYLNLNLCLLLIGMSLPHIANAQDEESSSNTDRTKIEKTRIDRDKVNRLNVEAKSLSQARVPWCHGGTRYDSGLQTLTEAQLLDLEASYPNAFQNFAHKAQWLAGNYCDEQFTIPSQNPGASSGHAQIKEVIGPPNYLQAAGIVGVGGNAYYTMADGLTFICQRCNEPFETIPDPVPKGMTWKKINTDDVAGVAAVGCGSGSEECDPYNGDEFCSAELPVLCFYPDSNLTIPDSVTAPNQYSRWANGVVGTTPPVSPIQENFDVLADVNAYCAAQFGPEWRIAEFHEGWGWNFKSYGNVGEVVARFWVNINDQSNGNCWAQQ